MLVYKNYIPFIIKGKEVNIISEEIGNVLNTVSEINNKYYYLGAEYPNVLADVLGWEIACNEELNVDELHQVMVENKLVSDAV